MKGLTHRKRTAVLGALVLAGTLCARLVATPALAVTVDPQPVSITILSAGTEELTPPFTAKFEASGTHVKDGLLKIRIDLYPSAGSKCYDVYYVTLPKYSEEELTENPELKQEYYEQLNPCLCHFVVVDKDTTREEVEAYTAEVFDQATVSQLDDLFASPTPEIGQIAAVMREKAKLEPSPAIVGPSEVDKTIGDTNEKLADSEITVGDTSATP